MVAVAAMADWPRNKGAEAIATHPRDGTVIIGGNKTGKSGLHPLLWYSGDPAQTKPDILKFQAQRVTVLPMRHFLMMDACLSLIGVTILLRVIPRS